MSPTLRTRAAVEAGFILVAVLWIIAALATLATLYVAYLSTGTMAAATRTQALEARSLFTAGVELSALRLLSVPKPERPTSGAFAVRMGRATVAVRFRNEAARIDLNAAPKDVIAGLFAALGDKPDAAQDHAERVIGWRGIGSGAAPTAEEEATRDPDAPPVPIDAAPDADAEARLYRDAGLDYGPRGGPFAHPDELWRVAALPPDLVRAALPHVTIYSGRRDVLAKEADPLVRAALPDTRAESALAQPGKSSAASSTAANSATKQAPPPSAGLGKEGSDAVRIGVRVTFDDGFVQAAEAVILLRDFGADPYRVLAWSEDLDMPSPAQAKP